ALQRVLDVCRFAEKADGSVVDLGALRDRIEAEYRKNSAEGRRTLGVAYRPANPLTRMGKDDEKDLIFLGFLVLGDVPKPDVAQTVVRLNRLGISLKIITGDNPLVAAQVGREVGLARTGVLTGPEMRQMSEEALVRRVQAVDIFADVEPNQKEW